MNNTFPADKLLIVHVDNEDQLKEAVSFLKKNCVLALDTEFDSMRTKYGMNLELIQIYDGRKVYLIRACFIKDISVLKTIVEDEKIIKLIYSAREDIPALKSRGLFLQGLYDLQEASKLAHLESKSYVQLIKELIGVELNKIEQKSNWRAKKLSDDQLAYAANDVIYNIQLYSILKDRIQASKNETILNEKNKAIEKAPLKEFEPKLKSKHRALNTATKRKILALLKLRVQFAKKRNVPPIYVFPDELIDELVAGSNTFDCISYFKNCPRPYKVDSSERRSFNSQIKTILLR
jgi:ribonuclease D